MEPFLDGDDTGVGEEIATALTALEGRFRDEFSDDDLTGVPEVMWRAGVAYQCLYRRTVESAVGVKLAWKAGNLITVVTMARSLLETGAIAWRLTDHIEKALEKKDAAELYAAIMKISFGNRVNLIEEKEEEYRAVNILTAIEHMNTGILKGKEESFIDIYNCLSEIAHPNHWGILGLYGNHIEAEERIEFGNKHRKDDLWWMIGPALCVVWMVNDLAEEFEKKLLPAMAELVAK